MDISRRDFLYLAAALGVSATCPSFLEASAIEKLSMDNLMYDGFKPKGNVTLLHMCDWHAHLKPLYWREPSTLVSAKSLVGLPGFLSGEAFMKYYGLKKGSVELQHDEIKNIQENVTMPDISGRMKIVVLLVEKNQPIHFWTTVQ